MDASKLALAGLLGGSLAFGAVGCQTSGNGAETHAAAQYTEIHDCAGKNSCKGIGGCAVDAAKLAKLGEKAGKAEDERGEPHDCAGMNACQGLGGCAVDAAKLAELKSNM